MSECRCREIIGSDATRHFNECPKRADFPVASTLPCPKCDGSGRWVSGPDPLFIYVAGSSAEREHVAKFIKVLGEYGYAVTHDWTQSESYGKADEEVTEEELLGYAKLDLDAVRRAAVVWYLAPREGKSEGAAVELGAALALGKEVIVSGVLARQRIFPRLAEKCFVLHADALDYLRMRAREWL